MGEEGGRQEAGSRGGELCGEEEGGRVRGSVDDDAGDSGGLTDRSSFFFSLSVTEMLH